MKSDKEIRKVKPPPEYPLEEDRYMKLNNISFFEIMDDPFMILQKLVLIVILHN